MPITSLVHYETETDGVIQGFKVDAVLVDKTTAFQRARVYQTPAFGKVLVLDDETQSAQSDEAIYHETLVHPVFMIHPAPTNVLIIGGGEGATAREVLRYPSVKNVIMLDIDAELMEICKEHLPEWAGPAVWSDPRLHVHAIDAFTWLETHLEATFDIVIMDLCDPDPATPDNQINRFYTKEFIETLFSKHIRAGGLLVAQIGDYTALPEVSAVFREATGVVHNYVQYIPSFTSQWGFVLAGTPLKSASAAFARLPTGLKFINPGRLAGIFSHSE